MSTLLADFHFLQPEWLWLLLGLPLLAPLALRRRPAQAALRRLVDAELLPWLVQGQARHRWLPPALIAAGWMLGVLALAGPSWSRVEQPLYAGHSAQVVALSLSDHMLARDVAPSRLDRARYKARDLLAANAGGLNGLVAYAGEAFVVAPLTSDSHSLDDLLGALAPDTMPIDGNDAAAAITRGAAMIHDAKAGAGSLVLITDRAPPDALAAARQARADGVLVSVLGVGTPQGGPVPLADGGFLQASDGKLETAPRDDAGLAALAAAGGGRYVPMRDDSSDIDALRKQLPALRGRNVAGASSEQWQDRGPWVLLLLLPLAALAFRRGWVLLLALALLPVVPGRAMAGSWSDLWHRSDQQAAAALRHGRAREAQQLAHDPAWRGVAAYRAGDYAAAIEALRPLTGAQAQYNLGNALARAGHYREAIAAYDRALGQDPGDADAKANREAVQRWLRQHPPPADKQGTPQGKGKGKGQSKAGQDQSGQASQQPGNPSGKPSQQPQHDASRGQSDAPDHSGQEQGQEASKPEVAPQNAADKARAAKARQALQRQLDRTLGKKGKPAQGRGQGPHQLGALDPDDPQSKLPDELRQALQRVPDDPGALLRRKFEIEYRQRHGAPGFGGEQP